MRADVLQAVAMTCYGNAYLRGHGQEKAPELRIFHSTFRTVHEVAFERRGATVPQVMDDTGAWFSRMRSEGVEQIRLSLEKCSFEPSRSADPWGLVVDGVRGVEVWTPAWRARSADPDDSTPHRVIYNGAKISRWALSPTSDFQMAEGKLVASLEMAKAFCEQHQATPLGSTLEKLLLLHKDQNLDLLGFPDLCPSDWPLPGRRLLASGIRVALVLKHGVWGLNAFDAALKAEVSLNTLRMWHGAMMAFEAGANNPNALAEAKPSDPEDLPLAS